MDTTIQTQRRSVYASWLEKVVYPITTDWRRLVDDYLLLVKVSYRSDRFIYREYIALNYGAELLECVRLWFRSHPPVCKRRAMGSFLMPDMKPASVWGGQIVKH